MGSSQAEFLSQTSLSCNLAAMKAASVYQEPIQCVSPGLTSLSISFEGVVHFFRVVIYQLLTVLYGTEYRLHKLCKAIRVTQETFQETIQNTQKMMLKRQELLQKSGEGESVDPVQWVEITRELCGAINTFSIVKMKDSFQDTLKQIQTTADRLTAQLPRNMRPKNLQFRSSANIDGLFSQQPLLEFESLVEKIPPYTALKKLSTFRGGLEEHFESGLKEWIGKIEEKQLPPNLIHRALRTYLESQSNNKELSLSCLEWQLWRRGLKSLERTDREHLMRRKSLYNQETIRGKSKSYPIDERLLHHPLHEAGRAVFSIREDPKHLLVVGQNSAEISLDIERGIEDQEILPLVFIEVDGQVYLMEKLPTLLIGQKWKETSDPKLQSIVQLLHKLIGLKRTPVLQLGDFGYTESNQLKRMRPFEWNEGKNIDELVKFAKEVANGNLSIFRYLLGETGLKNHPNYAYFTQIVESSLKEKDNPPDCDDIAVEFNIDDSETRETARNLQREILTIEQSCWERVLSDYSLNNPAAFRPKIGTAIKREFRDILGVGIIWQGMEKTVIQSLVQKENLTKTLKTENVSTKSD